MKQQTVRKTRTCGNFEESTEKDIDNRKPEFIGHAREGLVAQDPCVVDDDIDPLVLVDDCSDDLVIFYDRDADRSSVRSSCTDVIGNNFSAQNIVHGRFGTQPCKEMSMPRHRPLSGPRLPL